MIDICKLCVTTCAYTIYLDICVCARAMGCRFIFPMSSILDGPNGIRLRVSVFCSVFMCDIRKYVSELALAIEYACKRLYYTCLNVDIFLIILICEEIEDSFCLVWPSNREWCLLYRILTKNSFQRMSEHVREVSSVTRPKFSIINTYDFLHLFMLKQIYKTFFRHFAPVYKNLLKIKSPWNAY